MPILRDGLCSPAIRFGAHRLHDLSGMLERRDRAPALDLCGGPFVVQPIVVRQPRALRRRRWWLKHLNPATREVALECAVKQIQPPLVEGDTHLQLAVLKSRGEKIWETAMQVEFTALRGELKTEIPFGRGTMKRTSHQLTVFSAIVFLGLCLAIAPGLQAAEADLSCTHSAPAEVSLGSSFTVTVGYANAGPETPTFAYVNSYHTAPMGMDKFIVDYVDNDGAMYYDPIQETSLDTDSLGLNVPLLFWDDYFCEDLLFQLQRDDDDTDANPAVGLDPGVNATFSFDVTIPMDEPRTGTIQVTEPASVAGSWTGSNPANVFVLQAAELNNYGRGGCDALVNSEEEDVCEYIDDNCFGGRVSLMPEPVEAVFELVNDGSADPTLGCEALVDFTPGNVALLRRGECEFGVKAFNAEQAGAIATIIVNTDQCSDFPADDSCVINLGAGALGGLVTTPVVMFAQADGEPLIAAVEGGDTVRGVFGAATQFSTEGYAFLSDTADTDPDETNDTSTFKSAVSAIPAAPVAAFTFAPAEPTTGAPVMFTDTSTGGAPTAWAWDFGDGSTSTEQNPSYTYASAGTFAVSLMVSNGGGSDSVSADVTVTAGSTFAEMYFIPAAALAAGAEGSFFQTDVDINNAGATADTFAFQWLPRNENNSEPTQSSSYSIGAGESIRFENVLSDVFGFEPPVSGALAVVSNTAGLRIQSRTYNLPTTKAVGTFGQALPGIYSANLIAQNEVKRIIFMSETDDLRANLGCVNGMNDNLPIKVTSYDDAGTMLETQTMSLAPYSNSQINRIFEDFAPTNGYVDVTSIKVGAGFYCYGSVLDNGSNDPTSILPTEYGAEAPFVNYYIPAAALAAGAEGSFFQTDVDINNAGDAMATYQFMWLPRGENNSEATPSESFTLAAGASVRYENVLDAVFGLEPGVSGALAISADSASLGVMSRTYNVPTVKIAGTFGQAIPGIPASNLIAQNETKRIIFMSENDDLRANLGCVNGVNDNLPIKITLYDETGTELGTESMNLSPWSNNQINQIFGDYAPTNGYADITSIKATAGYYCYGSVLDNGSNDPTTILPQ
jgi:PKD repeat protein